MCHAMPYSARALKKHFLWRWYCGKNKSKCGLSWSILLSTMSTHHYSFPKLFFSSCFCMLSEFAKVFERKVWCVHVAHLHKAASALSSRSRRFQMSPNLDKDFFRYLWYCGKKQIECGLAWSVLLSTTIRVITVVKICCETISSSDTSIKREMAIFKISPPVRWLYNNNNTPLFA